MFVSLRDCAAAAGEEFASHQLNFAGQEVRSAFFDFHLNMMICTHEESLGSLSEHVSHSGCRLSWFAVTV